jgi:Flp pilus assembly pilin Flp
MMPVLEYVKTWLLRKFKQDETGQTATEYVLVILGVVLFLVFAAFALNGILGGATNAIQNWINQVAPPPAP